MNLDWYLASQKTESKLLDLIKWKCKAMLQFIFGLLLWQLEISRDIQIIFIRLLNYIGKYHLLFPYDQVYWWNTIHILVHTWKGKGRKGKKQQKQKLVTWYWEAVLHYTYIVAYVDINLKQKEPKMTEIIGEFYLFFTFFTKQAKFLLLK